MFNRLESLRTFLKDLRSGKYNKAIKFQLEIRPTLQGIPYWTAAGLVGIIAVIYSRLFDQAIAFTTRVFEQNPYILFVTSPICFFLATYLVYKFAPTAGGTGVPQVTTALALDHKTHSQEINNFLNLKVALVVALSSLLCVLGGGGLGREGPMVHMAACIFYFVGRQFHKIWPYEEHRSWIVAGGAAGIAAAFNAPLAGVVFVLEELSHQHFHRFKNVVIAAAIIGGLVSQGISGRYLYFGYPAIGAVPMSATPWAIVVGVVCGLCAYPFRKIVTLDWKTKFPLFNSQLKFAPVSGLMVAGLAFFAGKGTIGGGISVIGRLLFSGETADWSLILGRLLSTTISSLSGCAGGFLAPALALGAAIGSKIAVLADYPHHNLMVLVGMSAFLGAIIRAPFTAWVIVMEMTDRHSAIFPLMVASLVSSVTAQRLFRTTGLEQMEPPRSPNE